MRVLFALTDHGFGHATRQMAVAQALRRLEPRARVTFWTTAPPELFAGYLGPPTWYDVERVATDVGLAQRTSLDQDLDETHARLARLWSDEGPVPALAERIRAARFERVLADIPPAAMLAAARARVPVVAAGNFDWAFVYGCYAAQDPRFERWHALALEAHATAPLALWMEPGPALVGFARVEPVGLVARRARGAARAADGVGDALGARMDGERRVLLSFGGFGLDRIEERIPRLAGVRWLTAPPGPSLTGRDDVTDVRGHPYPDLVAVADVVLSKPGYGTIAECAANRARFVYASRPGFPETPHLVRWVERHLPSAPLAGFDPGAVASALAIALAAPAHFPEDTAGAERVAARLLAHDGPT